MVSLKKSNDSEVASTFGEGWWPRGSVETSKQSKVKVEKKERRKREEEDVKQREGREVVFYSVAVCCQEIRSKQTN